LLGQWRAAAALFLAGLGADARTSQAGLLVRDAGKPRGARPQPKRCVPLPRTAGAMNHCQHSKANLA
ncbi:MAG: hypothetical protein ACRDG4_14170, partial [Chloroflexota bacterium]